MELIIFCIIFIVGGSVVTKATGISETLPLLYLLKKCFALFITMLPCIAVMWGITVFFEKSLFSMGLNVLFVIPSVLVANTSLWVIYPYCYSGYIVTCSLNDFTTAGTSTKLSLMPFVPCAMLIFVVTIIFAASRFGKKEMR